MIVYGLNAVREALRADRVAHLRVGPRTDARVREIVDEASRRGVVVERVDAAMLDRAAGGARHQGLVATVRAGPADLAPADLVSGADGPALVVVLDGIEDPHNVGAIVRTCDAVGASGLVRQARHAAPLGGATGKSSAGAVAHVRVATVVNLVRALQELKGAGVWVTGLAADAPRRYDEVDYAGPTAFVLGSEGAGLRRLVRESCDWLVSIPMAGHVGSLNVSVAAGVVLFEALRQRRGSGRG